MHASLAVAAALAFGIAIELVASLVGRFGGRVRPWWHPLQRFGADVRLLVVDRDRASIPEALGTGIVAFAAGLTAAVALGATPGSAVLVYLGLGAAAAGAHLAASTPLTEAGRTRARLGRLQAFAAEPAFVLGLAVPFLRWRSGDLVAIRGAHEVLGGGLQVGRAPVVVGLAIGVLALLAATALRAPEDPGREAGAGGGPSLAVVLSSWLLLGATALVAGALVAARMGSPGLAQLADPRMITAVGGAAVVLGLLRGVLFLIPPRARTWSAVGAALLALTAALLVVLP